MSDVTHVPSEGLYIFHSILDRSGGCSLYSWIVDGDQVHTAQTECKTAGEGEIPEEIKAKHIALLAAKVKETNNGRNPSS